MQVHSKWTVTSAADNSEFKPDTRALPSANGETNYAVERASELLFKIQDEATGLILNAEILRALTRESQSNLEGHLAYLQEIKTRINAIRDRTFDLRRIRADVLAWQRDTIAELAVHGALVAESTEEAMAFLNEKHESLFRAGYRQHVNTLADASQEIRQTMTRFFDGYMMQQRSRREAALILATE